MWRPCHLISTHPSPPHSVPPWKIIFLVGVAALALLIYGVFLSPGVWGKNLDLTIPVGGTGPVAIGSVEFKCWIALSFRRKSTRAPICRRRPFDRLEIIIGQGSLARTDNHERKNMHVILKLLYTSDPSALACVLWIVTTIWLASFWSIYRGRKILWWTRVRMKITDHSSKSGWQTNAAFLYWYLRDGLFHG